MQQKVGAEKGCTKERQQILFIFDSVKTGRHDKGRFVQPSAVPGRTLSLQRKMIATSAKSIYEKAGHIVT